jgi:phosphate-selective porin OprO/OprP
MYNTRRPSLLAVALLTSLTAFVCVSVARAQSPESEPAPPAGEFEAAPPPDQDFVIPELTHSFVEKTQVRSGWFTANFGLVALVDYSAFQQDASSLAQVGLQSDQWDARSLRPAMSGTIGGDYRVDYLVAAEYQGFATEPGDSWELTDFAITFELGRPATKLTVGKIKETFVYEMVGDAANLPQQDRILNPFFIARDVGARLTQVIGEAHRMTASLGVYNDWWLTGESLAESRTDVSARITGLAWDQSDGTSYLHLGVSGRYAGADNKTLRYKGRPESNVTDLYVDTGDLPAGHARHLGLEALWNEGPFSLLAEYNRAWVDSPTSGNPEFSGYYITGSWILTGESRPYDRTVGYARRVMPTGRWGAPELVARFSHVDLNDELVLGGKFDKTYLGINWWANQRMKLGLGWGHTRLLRFGQTGVTDSIITRVQWIF